MTFADFIDIILNLIQAVLVPFITGLTVVYFIFGVVKYIWSGGSSEKRKEGMKYMITGIIAIFIMITIWAIVGVFANSLGSSLGIPVIGNSTES